MEFLLAAIGIALAIVASVFGGVQWGEKRVQKKIDQQRLDAAESDIPVLRQLDEEQRAIEERYQLSLNGELSEEAERLHQRAEKLRQRMKR